MKSTKKSLLISILSITLCVAMLLGTTYAWFTDSVQSGVNQIVAGNLDVELLHTNAKVTNQTVKDETNLFVDKNGEAILWEPGVYSYETFTIKNVGNLALKYKMAINVASFTSYDGHNLTEVLKVKELDTAPTSRDDITGGTLLNAWSHSSEDVVLNPNAEKTFTVAIYWEPGENDNLYNMNNGRPQPLSIDLGVSLVATQATVENDSFDEKYDKDAENTLAPAAKVETAMAAAVAGQPTKFTVDVAPAEGKKTEVEFEAGALEEGSYKLDVETENNLFEMTSDHGEAATIDLKLYDKDGALTTAFENNKKATITTFVTKGLKNPQVRYNGDGDQPTFISYNPETGELKFSTNHFSEYEVETESVAYIHDTDYAYDTLQDAITAAADGATIKMLCDTEYTDAGFKLENKNLDLNGHKMTFTRGDGGPRSFNLYGDVTISNGSIEASLYTDTYGAIYANQESNVTLNDVNVKAYKTSEPTVPAYGAAVFGGYLDDPNGNMVINGGVFDSLVTTNGSTRGGSLTINDGIFNEDLYLPAYMNYTINGGTFNKCLEFDSGIINISGGTFNYAGDYEVWYSNTEFVPANKCSVILLGYNGPLDNSHDSGYGPTPVLNITGGTFAGKIGLAREKAEYAYSTVTKTGVTVETVELGVNEAN